MNKLRQRIEQIIQRTVDSAIESGYTVEDSEYQEVRDSAISKLEALIAEEEYKFQKELMKEMEKNKFCFNSCQYCGSAPSEVEV